MAHEALDAGPGKLAPDEAQKITGQVTWLSVAVAATLVCAKLVAWIASGSVAILASLADSALDLVASLTTFFAVRYAASPADAEHRFGHGKAEALASLLQALLVALSAGFLIHESWQRFLDPQPMTAGTLALSVMGLSVVLTLGLVWAQTRAVQKTGSLAVSGDRAHYFADLGSNMVVIAGLALALFGWQRADPIMGFLVVLWLFWTAYGVGKEAVQTLMDRELPDSDRDAIIAPLILGVQRLRTRASGPFVHIQFHIDLAPDTTLRQSHLIEVAAEQRVMSAYPGAEVLIHPDPHGAAGGHGNTYLGTKVDETAPDTDKSA